VENIFGLEHLAETPPFGRRIEKTVEEIKVHKTKVKTYTYVYDNEDIILEILTNSKGKKIETSRYLHGPGIDEPLAIEQKGKVYFYHADGLGSIITLSDHKGKVVQSYEYSAFGELKHHGNKVKSSYTYTGREWDKETGLYFYRARYYDPTIGRFISKDPIGFAGGDINLYGYVRNNPVNWIDPYRLIRWGTVGKGAGKVVLGALGVVGGAAAAATPTVAGQALGTVLVLGGSSSFSYGVSQIVAGFLDAEVPFMGTKEAIIKGTTPPGLTQDTLLGMNEILDMFPDIASGRLYLPSSKMADVADYIQYGISIGKSAEQIQEELMKAGLLKERKCK